jgi:hypothetical protein
MSSENSVGNDRESSQGPSPRPSHEQQGYFFGPPLETETDKAAKGVEDYRKAEEAKVKAAELNLEAAKLKVFGGGSRGGAPATPLVGPGGLRILTDRDLPSADSQRWIVKNIIPDSGVGIIFGDSGTFKSFIALDLLAAIATGRERWFGYRVKQVPCVYVPFEGKGGIPKRVEAWRLARLMQQVSPTTPVFPLEFNVTTGIRFITDPLSLRTKEDRDKLVEALTSNGLAGGVLCIDTLAQAGGGIDENSSAGMGEMITAFQDLQNRLGGVVTSTHHTGKDQSKGMRGHSSLRGAVDFAIECSRDQGAPSKYDAQMRLDKVKDEESEKVIPFTMQRVTVGMDEDGDHITSLVVVEPPADLGNMPTMQEPSSEQMNASDDEFVWNWMKRECEAGTFPSIRSLSSKINEMKQQHRKDLKREHVRDSVARLVACRRVQEEKSGAPGGQKWLRAVESTPSHAPRT